MTLTAYTMIGDYSVGRVARLITGDKGNHPVLVVDGDTGPQAAGDSYYFTTLSGKTIVHSPAAYKWPTLYHASTRHINVGAGWVAELLASGGFRHDTTHGVDTMLACGSRQIIHGWRADAGMTHVGEKIWLVSDGERTYHAARKAYLRDARHRTDGARGDARRAVQQAISAFVEQRKTARIWSAGLGRPLDAIWVDEASSVLSGNCRAGTEQQAQRVRRAIGQIGAVRADVLLSDRNDDFTRRAVARAATRGGCAG